MPFCPNCGTEHKDGQKFCKVCGGPLSNAAAAGTSRVLSDPPQPQVAVAKPGRGAHRATIISAVVLALTVVVCLVVVGVTWGGGKSDSASSQDAVSAEVQKESQDEESAEAADGDDEESADAADEEAPVETVEVSPEESKQEKAYKAYADVVKNADSYLGYWFEHNPDTPARYSLVEISGDDVPELMLSTHYSNVGSHASGGWRYLPFFYDEESDTANPITHEKYNIFAEPYNLYKHTNDGHAIVAEARYANADMSSRFFKIHAEGTNLIYEEISSAEAESLANGSLYDGSLGSEPTADCGDLSLLGL